MLQEAGAASSSKAFAERRVRQVMVKLCLNNSFSSLNGVALPKDVREEMDQKGKNLEALVGFEGQGGHPLVRVLLLLLESSFSLTCTCPTLLLMLPTAMTSNGKVSVPVLDIWISLGESWKGKWGTGTNGCHHFARGKNSENKLLSRFPSVAYSLRPCI